MPFLALSFTLYFFLVVKLRFFRKFILGVIVFHSIFNVKSIIIIKKMKCRIQNHISA